MSGVLPVAGHHGLLTLHLFSHGRLHGGEGRRGRSALGVMDGSGWAVACACRLAGCGGSGARSKQGMVAPVDFTVMVWIVSRKQTSFTLPNPGSMMRLVSVPKVAVRWR